MKEEEEGFYGLRLAAVCLFVVSLAFFLFNIYLGFSGFN